MNGHRIPDNCAMVIFGASGDLTHRKLIPALYNLAVDGLLPKNFSVIGFARKAKTDDEFRAEAYEGVKQFSRSKPVNEEVWAKFSQLLHYNKGDYGTQADYEALDGVLKQVDADHQTGGNRLFYLSTPPEVYKAITENLGVSGLAKEELNTWKRVIIEKPFGHDLSSARELNDHVHKHLNEKQIYRMDHYLGKETVQNILVFRFANGIFEPLWDYRYVDHVQITVSESIGIEGRGGYYETSGVIRDIVQNHLLQLLALTAMEPPAEFEADAVRNEKVKVLKALRVDTSRGDGTVRGQYGPGKVGGVIVPGYLQEEGVDDDSQTETFLAMKFFIDNWRWAGVPVYVRSGKRMPARLTEIAIIFKKPPMNLFSETAAQAIEANELLLHIQPDEGISLKFGSKVPGSGENIKPVVMDFKYGESFNVPAPEAYERLILDCIFGDPTLFTRGDEVEAQWQIITPVIEKWQSGHGSSVDLYRAGAAGPKAADEFIKADGRWWRPL